MVNCPAHEVPRRVVDRVLSKVVKSGDCLVSTYATNGYGYPSVGFHEAGTQYNALTHRVAWAAVNGPIPAGHEIHHTCFNRGCVNPNHLRSIEKWQNARRTNGQDWPLGTCKYGHDDSLMVYVASEKKRRCSICYATQRKARTQRAAALRRERRLQLADR